MLIELIVIATAGAVTVLLTSRSLRLGDRRERGERIGAGIEPPGSVSAGPVVVGPRAEGQGAAGT